MDENNLIKTFENLVITNFHNFNNFEEKNNYIMKQTSLLE